MERRPRYSSPSTHHSVVAGTWWLGRGVSSSVSASWRWTYRSKPSGVPHSWPYAARSCPIMLPSPGPRPSAANSRMAVRKEACTRVVGEVSSGTRTAYRGLVKRVAYRQLTGQAFGQPFQGHRIPVVDAAVARAFDELERDLRLVNAE